MICDLELQLFFLFLAAMFRNDHRDKTPIRNLSDQLDIIEIN